MKSRTLFGLFSAVLLSSVTGHAELTALGHRVTGLSIDNAHVLAMDASGRPTVVRGKAPTQVRQIRELQTLGITDVLIFKNDTKGEVAEEIQALTRAGVPARNILHVPMPWRDLPDFRTTCRLTLQALNRILAVEKSGGRVYFHCTVGEDRTGYLAGLYDLASGKSRSVKDVFEQEMCRRGYEAGNPRKPMDRVVLPIRTGLTPAFLEMARRILERGTDPAVCEEPFLGGQNPGPFICR